MSVYDKSLITVLACSAVLSLVSIPLILGKVPRNRVYGYRTRATLGSEALWYRANAYFGVRFLVATLVSAGIAVALYQWQALSPRTHLQVSVLLLVGPAGVACALTARLVRAGRAGEREPSPPEPADGRDARPS